MFTKTILCTPIRGGTQQATWFATRIVDRYVQRLQPSDQIAQWVLAMAEVRLARISALSYRLEGDELIIQNAKHEKKLVHYGRASCVVRTLMSCDVVEWSERTFGKLLSKLQQVDLLETQPFVDVSAGHNFKKGKIMHIVNNMPKGNALGNGNCAEFYMYHAAAS
jgi:hypothetical protein